MIYLILFIILISVLIMPQLWVQSVLKRYGKDRKDIPGTGEQFAQHLLKRLALPELAVKQSETADYYSPEEKAVYLHKDRFSAHSLTALVVAAHEVGHAIQDHENYHWMQKRQRLVQVASVIAKVAPISLAVAPVLLLITKVPGLSLLVVLLGFSSIILTALMHLITLPVELDASFNKALPLLYAGRYLPKDSDYLKAKTILRAAALTYLAQSLINTLSLGYWLRMLAR